MSKLRKKVQLPLENLNAATEKSYQDVERLATMGNQKNPSIPSASNWEIWAEATAIRPSISTKGEFSE